MLFAIARFLWRTAVRWCPHNVMMVDLLTTKRLHKDELQPLPQVMKSGHHTLGSELAEEESRQ